MGAEAELPPESEDEIEAKIPQPEVKAEEPEKFDDAASKVWSDRYGELK